MVSRCGELGGESIQLAVLRALLTIATADHFVVHGDCLMQVRLTQYSRNLRTAIVTMRKILASASG